MTLGRTILTALVVAALALSACGLKGDPVRPGSEKDKKTQSSGS